MVFTSVSGHLMELEFGQQHRTWKSVPPFELYQVPVYKQVPQVCIQGISTTTETTGWNLSTGARLHTYMGQQQPSCAKCLSACRVPRCASQGLSTPAAHQLPPCELKSVHRRPRAFASGAAGPNLEVEAPG